MPPRKRYAPFQVHFSFGAVVALGLTLVLYYRGGLHWVVSYLLGVNGAIFVLYGWDKLCAKRRWSRVPEAVLHTFAFAGGTPAAYVAQQVFRHKTLKSRFRRTFWVLAVLQVAIVAAALWFWHYR